jgi:hypothetical protein
MFYYLIVVIMLVFAAYFSARLGKKMATRSKLKGSAITLWLMCSSIFDPKAETAYHEIEREKKKPIVQEDNRNK